MAAEIQRLRDRASETEKITINLGYVDLGHIDLLVQEGFYSNRTDFIRTAIRNQLATHGEEVRKSIVRRTLELGLRHFTRADLEAARAAGEKLHIKVLGLTSIAPDVSPELTLATIESINVLGALHAPKISGDELFSAMGTTIRKAKSTSIQYKVDVTYQHEFAKAASENGTRNYFLLSSVGANAKSKLFYTRIKGELDEKVQQLSFSKIRILRPSLLLGERPEKRFGEKTAERILKIVVPIFPFLKTQRPIEGEKVADAMLASANIEDNERIRIYELDEIFELAKAED